MPSETPSSIPIEVQRGGILAKVRKMREFISSLRSRPESGVRDANNAVASEKKPILFSESLKGGSSPSYLQYLTRTSTPPPAGVGIPDLKVIEGGLSDIAGFTRDQIKLLQRSLKEVESNEDRREIYEQLITLHEHLGETQKASKLRSYLNKLNLIEGK